MAVNIAIVRTTLNSGTGTQDFTVSGFGTCKGALVWTSSPSADTGTGGACVSYGAVTGASNRWAAVAMTEDAAGRTDVSRIFF
ncbi:hypothetical protein LCGC14_3042280, partial [marine sediment metagenome]